MPDRQTGTTSDQILSAPCNAVYVWPNSHLAYPKALASRLGRTDLRVASAQALLPDFRRPVVVDHACYSLCSQATLDKLLWMDKRNQAQPWPPEVAQKLDHELGKLFGWQKTN